MNNPQNLSLNTVVQWDAEQITTEIAGEVIAMSIRQGVYVGLDHVASLIWKRLSVAQTVESLCAQLSREFEGDRETITNDVIELLGGLRELGLLAVREEAAAACAAA